MNLIRGLLFLNKKIGVEVTRTILGTYLKFDTNKCTKANLKPLKIE